MRALNKKARTSRGGIKRSLAAASTCLQNMLLRFDFLGQRGVLFTSVNEARCQTHSLSGGGGVPVADADCACCSVFFSGVFPRFPLDFHRSRSFWHGVSSQGMLYVGPLGDDSEALRLESMAGRGGGSSNARSVHAIRCFNAQVTPQGLKRHNILHIVAVCYTCDSTMGAVPTLYGAKRGTVGELIVDCLLSFGCLGVLNVSGVIHPNRLRGMLPDVLVLCLADVCRVGAGRESERHEGTA